MHRNTQVFKRSERLKAKTLFDNLYREGRYFKSGNFSLRLLPNNINITRLGISAKKDIFQKATQRNKVKRFIREAFRVNKHKLSKGYDILIRPKSIGLINSDYRVIEKELVDLLNRAGMLKGE